jgi:hypothetical protein
MRWISFALMLLLVGALGSSLLGGSSSSWAGVSDDEAAALYGGGDLCDKIWKPAKCNNGPSDGCDAKVQGIVIACSPKEAKIKASLDVPEKNFLPCGTKVCGLVVKQVDCVGSGRH